MFTKQIIIWRRAEKKGKCALPGIFTVELALLLPVLLLALIGSIYVIMHFHNSASLAVGACEIAVRKDAEAAIPELLFVGDQPVPKITENAAARSVQFDSGTRWQEGRNWEIKKSAIYESVTPVTEMNRIRAMKRLANNLFQEETSGKAE